jgi:hypothetical protein
MFIVMVQKHQRLEADSIARAGHSCGVELFQHSTDKVTEAGVVMNRQ